MSPHLVQSILYLLLAQEPVASEVLCDRREPSGFGWSLRCACEDWEPLKPSELELFPRSLPLWEPEVSDARKKLSLLESLDSDVHLCDSVFGTFDLDETVVSDADLCDELVFGTFDLAGTAVSEEDFCDDSVFWTFDLAATTVSDADLCDESAFGTFDLEATTVSDVDELRCGWLCAEWDGTL